MLFRSVADTGTAALDDVKLPDDLAESLIGNVADAWALPFCGDYVAEAVPDVVGKRIKYAIQALTTTISCGTMQLCLIDSASSYGGRLDSLLAENVIFCIAHAVLGLYMSADRITAPILGRQGVLAALFCIESLPGGRKEGVISQLFAVGRIVSDLELRVSVRQIPFTRFTLVEHVGTGRRAHDQYFCVIASGTLANQLINAGVRSSSLVWVAGSLELVEVTGRDTVTTDRELRIMLQDWGFLPSGNSWRCETQSGKATPESGTSADKHAAIVYGDREPLPG